MTLQNTTGNEDRVIGNLEKSLSDASEQFGVVVEALERIDSKYIEAQDRIKELEEENKDLRYRVEKMESES